MKFLLIAILVAGSNAFAGGDSGHGAGALKCGDKLRFLDLLEAEEDGLTVPPDDVTPAEQQAVNAIEKLCPVNPQFCARVKYFYEQAKSIRTQPPKGKRLSPPTDAALKHIPEECHFVGIGKWHDSESGKDDYLEVQDNDLEKMNNTDQAAFLVHEPVFKAFREMIYSYYNVFKKPVELPIDSRASRFMVGRLFSTEKLPALMDNAQGPIIARCTSWFGDFGFLTSDGVSKIAIHVTSTPYRWSFGAKTLVREDARLVSLFKGTYNLKNKETYSVTFEIEIDLLAKALPLMNNGRVVSENIYSGAYTDSLIYQKPPYKVSSAYIGLNSIHYTGICRPVSGNKP